MNKGVRVAGQFFTGLLGAVTIVLCGCGRQESKDDTLPHPRPMSPTRMSSPVIAPSEYKIVLITNGFSPFWDSLQQGMKDAASKYGVTAEWAGPPHSQVEEQETLTENFADKGFDSIAVSTIDAELIGVEIDSLVKRGLHVITFDSDAPKSKRLIYIGTDNFQSGVEAGKAMIKLLPGGGKVWGFVGHKSADNARERREGFEQAVAGHNIQLVDVLEDENDPGAVRQNVETVIQEKGPQISAMLGFFSYDLPAIADAVRQANLRSRVKIVGFDADPATLLDLQNGGVDATVVQKPYEFGRLSVEFLYLAKKDGPAAAIQEWNALNPDFPIKNGKINTGVNVITPQNVGAFLKQLKKWGVTSS